MSFVMILIADSKRTSSPRSSILHPKIGAWVLPLLLRKEMLPHTFYKLSAPKSFLRFFIGWRKSSITRDPLLLENISCRVSLRWHFTSNILTITPLPIIDIFANLAGYVKLHLDSKSDNNGQMTKETILDFWDRMAEAKNYSQVDKTDFKKRTRRLLPKNKSQKVRTPIDECTFFSTEPPRKVAVPTSSLPWSILFCQRCGPLKALFLMSVTEDFMFTVGWWRAVIDGELTLSENRPKCYWYQFRHCR